LLVDIGYPAYAGKIQKQEARMRHLLLLALVAVFVASTGPAFAADNAAPSGKEHGQGHDCHKPKPPETS
jgi:hypothetical protein